MFIKTAERVFSLALSRAITAANPKNPENTGEKNGANPPSPPPGARNEKTLTPGYKQSEHLQPLKLEYKPTRGGNFTLPLFLPVRDSVQQPTCSLDEFWGVFARIHEARDDAQKALYESIRSKKDKLIEAGITPQHMEELLNGKSLSCSNEQKRILEEVISEVEKDIEKAKYFDPAFVARTAEQALGHLSEYLPPNSEMKSRVDTLLNEIEDMAALEKPLDVARLRALYGKIIQTGVEALQCLFYEGEINKNNLGLSSSKFRSLDQDIVRGLAAPRDNAIALLRELFKYNAFTLDTIETVNAKLMKQDDSEQAHIEDRFIGADQFFDKLISSATTTNPKLNEVASKGVDPQNKTGG